MSDKTTTDLNALLNLKPKDKEAPPAKDLASDLAPPNSVDRLNGRTLTEKAFPHRRLRRLRASAPMRRMVRENTLNVDDLIYPLFVEEHVSEQAAIPSMPGVIRQTEESLSRTMKEVGAKKIPAVMLFGVSHSKCSEGKDSLSPNGLLARIIDRAKQAAPDTLVMADLCFCDYTDHGHCGPFDARGDVDNDKTLENIAMQAVIAAEAGADIVAPSAMMDGQVAVIRHALDVTGHSHIPVLSYAAKFASGFYGPFRDAAGCSLAHADNKLKDRKTYQMDPANAREAVEEALMDEAEGADMLMVKPGMAYLDILKTLRERSNLPLAAYQVSGEYAMMKLAAEAGALDYQTVMMESLMAFKRAGADMILSYAALDAADWLA